MALLTRSAILAANDLPTRDIAVPEWGGDIRVRSMTAFDRDQFELAIRAQHERGETMSNIRAHYAAACIVDENGDPLFSVEDVEALGRKSGAALDRVFSAITEMNALNPGDVEQLAGNSPGDRNAA